MAFFMMMGDAICKFAMQTRMFFSPIVAEYLFSRHMFGFLSKQYTQVLDLKLFKSYFDKVHHQDRTINFGQPNLSEPPVMILMINNFT